MKLPIRDEVVRRFGRRLIAAVFLLSVSVFMSGCATHALWNDGAVSFHEPAQPVPLALFDAPGKQDVIVQYDELAPGRDVPRRRAYYLLENSQRVRNVQKPVFISLSATNGLTSIPLFREEAFQQLGTNQPSLYALSSTNGNRFVIYRNKQEWDYPAQLPSYRCWITSFRRTTLTPVAIALDVTIIGGYIYASSLTHGHACLPN